MSNTATAFSRRIEEARQTAAVTRPTAKVKDDPFAAISDNPICKIMLSEQLTPEQKCDEVAKYLTYPGTKEESKAHDAAYAAFEEYLQSVREQMARQIIELTDTETFGELKSVYDDLNTALLDFDERMKPLTDIVDAIYILRQNDKTLAAFREIQNDRKEEQDKRMQLTEKKYEADRLERTINTTQVDIARLSEEKTFFGYGNIKKAARQDIAVKEQLLSDTRSELDHLALEVKELEAPDKRISELGDLVTQKDKLRELLDISSDDHKERQKALVDAALKFCSVAKTRIGSVRGHLGQMNDQIDRLYDANGRITNVYATLTEGIKEAEKTNAEMRAHLEPPKEGNESLLKKMAREENKLAVEEHLRRLSGRAADTTVAYSDLASQTIRIGTMRSANESQIEKARTLHTQGVAGVADRLSVVLQAVSGAALSESSEMAKSTLQKMIDSTGSIAQKESIRVAMGASELNKDVVKAIDDLASWGEVTKTATDLTRAGLTDMRASLDRIKELAETVRDDIHEGVAVHADVMTQKPEPARSDDTKSSEDMRPLGV